MCKGCEPAFYCTVSLVKTYAVPRVWADLLRFLGNRECRGNSWRAFFFEPLKRPSQSTHQRIVGFAVYERAEPFRLLTMLTMAHSLRLALRLESSKSEDLKAAGLLLAFCAPSMPGVRTP